MACQNPFLPLTEVTPHATISNSITLRRIYQDLGTFCGAGYTTQLLTHVCRVLVSPDSTAAAPWYMTNADRNPPPQADFSFLSNIQEGKWNQYARRNKLFRVSAISTSTENESGHQELYGSKGVGEGNDPSTSGVQDNLLYCCPCISQTLNRKKE